MNKFFVICLLLPYLAECVIFNICEELKCGTKERKDACASLDCPLPTPPPSNGTTTPNPSNNTSPENIIWPPPYPVELPNDDYPFDYPFYQTPPYFYPEGYPPFDPYFGLQPPVPNPFY